MDSFDFINRDNAAYIESLYEQYLKDPRSLDSQWISFFAGYDLGHGHPKLTSPDGEEEPHEAILEITTKGVYALVHYYRELGHFVANLDPLGHNRQNLPLLELSEFGLSVEDLDQEVSKGGFLGPTDETLRDLLQKLKITYCQTLGVEYTWISDKAQRSWLQERMEPILNKPKFTAEQWFGILNLLIHADEFEQFLHKRYLGKKRFSIEGADVLLVILDTLFETATAFGVEEMVMGMPHRGRLNVLAHLMNKPYELILSEFEESSIFSDSAGEGDVKYHLGYSTDRISVDGKKLHISLSSNPSHLELINPVIEGSIRAKQEYRGDLLGKRTVPVLIHGEAAFTGQGIVSETLNLSQLDGYQTGGTIHIIINNQLGFTATQTQTRYTPYPTDVMKMIEAPVFHVNADDPIAALHAAQMAVEFRQNFGVDVMIDLVCYRRYGHNESDDPAFTQPVMYKEIEKHPRVVDIFASRGSELEIFSQKDVERLRQESRKRLETAHEFAKELRPRQHISSFEGRWNGIQRSPQGDDIATSISRDVILKVAEKATRVPPDFSIVPKLKRLISDRILMAEGKKPVDWGCAEMFAIGSLLLEGFAVRLCGQDSQRGTFSHRHAVWHDADTGEEYVPLANLDENQAQFTILNTMLSELAVLGFEFGISVADPYRLTLWEAQFGDFINAAQPIIDEFICSSESKWERRSGIVLLLPHGYEGQGPDHSSARIERYLQLCAENNIQVCYPTMPSQYFHLLRRQIHQPFRKPLIVMTPKSLLRHKRSVSDLGEFTKGRFHNILEDSADVAYDHISRVIFCAGKIYFELLEAKEGSNLQDVAIVRLEQFYPFPAKSMQRILNQYKHVREIFWVQEEPENMGAWCFVERRSRSMLADKGHKLVYVGRDEAASPASGLYNVHLEEQKNLITRALEF